MSTDDVFPVIAEPTRRRILEALRPGQLAVGDLVEALGVSQPTVSKHLKVLREAGLVSMRADGQRRLYAVLPDPLREAARWLTGFGPAPGTDAAAGTHHPAAGANHAAGAGPAAAPAALARAAVPVAPAASAVPTPGATAPAASAPHPGTSAARPAAAAPSSSEAPDAWGAPAPGAVVVPAAPGSVAPVPHSQQIGRSVGRTVEQVTGRAQDLLDRLSKPKFGRRR